MAKLTKTEIDKAQPGDARYTLWDDEVRGFGVRVFPSGQKSFVVEYRPGARGVAKKRVTIGVYGRDLTPDAARKLAREMLADIRRGDDPAASRRRSRAMPTFRDFAEEYLREGKALGLSPNTITNYGVWLRLHAIPVLGGTRLDSVQPADVRRLHRAIGKTKPVTANRVVVAVRAVFNYAAAEELMTKEQNPVREVRLFEEQAVERFLTLDELERLGATLRLAETDGLPWTAPPRADRKAKHRRKPENRRTILGSDETAAFRLLLFTGLRLREILHARWSDVDMERGILTLPDSKTGRRPVILGEAALEVLRTHPRSSEFVIAGLDPEKPRSDLNRPWKAVKAHAGLEGLRLHDLRHSFASVGAAGGMGLQIVGRLLGHRHASTTARYAHLADDPQRRAADMIGGSIAAALAGKAKAA